jgi:hypothetical protein
MTNHRLRDEKRAFIGRAAALISLVIGASATWSWLAGVGDIFSIGFARSIAPASALTLLAASFGAWAAQRWPLRRKARQTGMAAAIFAGATGLGTVLCRFFNYDSPHEKWLVSILENRTETASGWMAMATAATFFVASTALWLRVRHQRPRLADALSMIVVA